MVGEDVDGGDAAEIAPIGPVVSTTNTSNVIIVDLLRRGEVGAVGKSDVVGREALVGDGGRGDDEDRAGTEAKEDNGTVAVGESGEGAVEGLLK